MIRILPILIIALLLGCAPDEHPSYKPIQNSLPSGGLTINYDPNNSLTNVPEIQALLNENDLEIFTKSLSWYGTESNFGFDKIHNKNARELVDIVNCLKVSAADAQNKCFK